MSSITDIDQQTIQSAVENYKLNSCLRFTELETNWFWDLFDSSNHIRFQKSDNLFEYSSSSVGMSGGQQTISLWNCPYGTVLHEIGHAIGFWHKQSRPDHDNYVQIHLNRIPQKEQFQFMKRKREEVDYQGTEYDYGSIMHYPRDAGHIIGCSLTCETITPIPNQNKRLDNKMGLATLT